MDDSFELEYADELDALGIGKHDFKKSSHFKILKDSSLLKLFFQRMFNWIACNRG